ncbi:hypothetical protein V6N12_018827 [Hibiscus sabdariffa]|uniref:Uncharacterized protein n=1 Tax=Hibiscus sabdariffa TaxID=183260 RepID=A0ABR2AUF4_9ROSI
MENPRENPDVMFGNLGGRPHDLVDQVGLSVVLERPASPMSADDQRLEKKIKNHDDIVIENLDHMSVEEMEADGAGVRENH